MERHGKQVRLCLPDGWQTENYGVFLQPLYSNYGMYLPDKLLLYLGPPNHDLTRLPNNMWIQRGGKRYEVLRAEMVAFEGINMHVWAVVKECCTA